MNLKFAKQTYIYIISIALCVAVAFTFLGLHLINAINPALAATNHTITYNANGGTLTGNSTVTATEGSTITLPNVEKVGYSAKWIDNPTWSSSAMGSATGSAISTRAELAAISGSNSYYLTKDIDLSGSNWTPISSFSGTLDGRGYAIKNMTISGSTQYIGLFAQMSGTVKNLRMININISSSYNGTGCVGGIVGKSVGGTFDNCYISGIMNSTGSGTSTINTNRKRIGGIVGDGTSLKQLTNCTNESNITSSGSNMYMGGIIAYGGGSNFKNLINKGQISCSAASRNGGILGYQSGNFTIYNSYNLGNITSGSNDLGGIVANGSSVVINNCFNAGNVSGGSQMNPSGGTINSGYYLSGTSGTAQGTAISSVSSLATTFYNNLSSSDKNYWAYTSGSSDYPVLWYDSNFSGNIGETKKVVYGLDHALTAQYTVNTYTINFNGNGASNTMANKSVTYGAGTQITNSFTLSGFNFAGWATTATAREPQYANSFNFDTTLAGANDNGKTFTLYAVWKSTLNLDVQGASNGTTSVTATRGLSMPSITKPTRTDWTFGGYWTEVGGKGTQYYNASGASVHYHDLAQGRTLYALWTSSINLDMQTGVGGTTNVTGTYNLAMPTATKPTKNGYTFDGYWTQKGGVGTKYYDKDMVSTHTYDLKNGATLFAKWVCGTVILDQQGGMGGSANVVPLYNGAMPTGITAPTKTGWTFGGYYTQIGGGGKQYYNSSMGSANNWTEATNITLYAKWTSTINLNMDGGANGSASIVVTYNAPMPAAIAPTRTGYSFGGYYTESNGNGTRFYNDQMEGVKNWDLNVSTALYAKWTPNVYVVTFEYNGATADNGVEKKNVTYGNFYSDLPLPSKAGAAFLGWYLESNFVTLITSTTEMIQTSDHRLYAKWVAWLEIIVSGTTQNYTAQTKFDQEISDARVNVKPATGHWVQQISLDNTTWRTIEYYETSFYDVPFALGLRVMATTLNNRIGIFLEGVYPEYIESTTIKIYIKTTNVAYGHLKEGGGGSVNGVAVSSTMGGMASILGDPFGDEPAEGEEITLIAKLTDTGYRFLGWCLSTNLEAPIYTEMSVKVEKKSMIGQQMVAVFVPVVNGNLNAETNN